MEKTGQHPAGTVQGKAGGTAGENPRIPSAALSGMSNCYKIKLRSAGYRLVYRVDDDIVFVTVIAIGKRNKLDAYARAGKRLL